MPQNPQSPKPPPRQAKIVFIGARSYSIPKDWDADAVRRWVKLGRPLSGDVSEVNYGGSQEGAIAGEIQQEKETERRNVIPNIAGDVGGMVGAAVGATRGAPITGATVGGAAGRSLGNVIQAATGEPNIDTSKDAAVDVAFEGAIQGGLEAVFRGVGWGAKKLVNQFVKKLPVETAGKYVADEIDSTGVSPRQIGQSIQQGYDKTVELAGKAKGSALKSIKEFVDANNAPVDAKNTIGVLDEQITLMEKRIGGGEISKENITKAQAYLNFLKNKKDELTTMVFPRKVVGFDRNAKPIYGPNPSKKAKSSDVLALLDETRSDTFQAARDYDRSLASNLSRQLSQATHMDISAAAPKPLMQAYETSSKRFRMLRESAENTKELSNVLSDYEAAGGTRVAPSKVIKEINKIPEDAVATLNEIRKASYEMGAPAPRLQTIRRAIFEDMINSGGLVDAREDVMKAVFGSSAKKVMAFAELVKNSGGKEAILSISSGRALGIQGPSLYIHTGPNRRILINSHELANILDAPGGLEMAEQLIRWPAKGAEKIPRVAQIVRAMMVLSHIPKTRERFTDQVVLGDAAKTTIAERMKARGMKPLNEE